jgi:DNA-binding Lrp family transcriptional regulator
MNGRFSIIPSRAINDKGLSKSALIVLNVLGMYGDKDGYSFPSQSTIAEHLGITRQAVQKSLKELKRLGYLDVNYRNDEDGSPLTCLYRILFDALLPVERDRSKNQNKHTHINYEVALMSQLTPHINAPLEHIYTQPENNNAKTILTAQQRYPLPALAKAANPHNRKPRNPVNEFDRFWQSLPESERIARQECILIWQQQNLDDQADHLIDDYTTRINQDENWRKFHPSVKTYLNYQRWNDAMKLRRPVHDNWLDD